MKTKVVVKNIAVPMLRAIQVDEVFRRINRRKILILAYHGLTELEQELLPWTVIPASVFEEQILYISKKYRVLPLRQVVAAMEEGEPLPDNTAVITFDDGYRNNLTIALPILKNYQVPATIFLTAGYVGTDEILPLDEVFLIISGAQKRATFLIPELGIGPIFFDSPDAVYEGYRQIVAALKKLPVSLQKIHIGKLKESLKPKYDERVIADLQMLNWDEVNNLLNSGLVDVGAHTISHEILTNIPYEAAEHEILESRALIERRTGQGVSLFAYPNGTPTDYDDCHVTCLRMSGFSCSVTTTGRLNDADVDLFRLGRICVGPEFSSSISQFALRVAGFNGAIRRALGKYAA